MSYCRVSQRNSDLYVIGTKEGYECLGCPLYGDGDYCSSRGDLMLAHLRRHVQEGHSCANAIGRLENELYGKLNVYLDEDELQIYGPYGKWAIFVTPHISDWWFSLSFAYGFHLHLGPYSFHWWS